MAALPPFFMRNNLEDLIRQEKELQEKLAAVSVAGDAERIKVFSIALTDVQRRIAGMTAMGRIERGIRESEELIAEGDPEFIPMAREELMRLRGEKAALAARIL